MRFFCCLGAQREIIESNNELHERGNDRLEAPAESSHRSSHRTAQSLGASSIHGTIQDSPPPFISPFTAASAETNDSQSIASRIGASLHGGISPANSGPLGSQAKHSGHLVVTHLNQQLVSKMRRVINHHSSPLMPLQMDNDSGSSSSLPKTNQPSGLLHRTRNTADRAPGNSNLGPAPSAPLATTLQAKMSSLVLLSNTSGGGYVDRQLGSRTRPSRSNIRLTNSTSKQSRPLDRVNESHLEGLTTP